MSMATWKETDMNRGITKFYSLTEWKRILEVVRSQSSVRGIGRKYSRVKRLYAGLHRTIYLDWFIPHSAGHLYSIH
jgi:hypothetical protein